MKRRQDGQARGSALPALVLLLACAGAGAAAWEASTSPIDLSPLAAESAQATPAVQRPVTVTFAEAGAPAVSYSETLARPLFNPTRRPVVPPKPKLAEKPPAPPLPPLQAQLVGLAKSATSGERALIRTASERQGAWLSVGEELAGWRLSEIASDRVVFKAGDGRQELFLVTPKTKGAKLRQP